MLVGDDASIVPTDGPCHAATPKPLEEPCRARKGSPSKYKFTPKTKNKRRREPGYVFVDMVMTEETWHLVNSTPRVIEFLGNNHPVPLSDAEIAAIKDRMSVGTEKARPKIMFEPGEIVRIKEGPFQDFNGRVEEILYDKSRLRCFVSIFGRETSVELAFNEVEKI